jgi:hemolysin III
LIHSLAHPRLRGVSHQWGFVVAVLAGGALIASAPTPTARVACSIYVASLCAMLGASALYHRIDWKPRSAGVIRRLDHSMIFVMVAGTYTPFALLVMTGPLAHFVLVASWTGALVGVAFTVLWTTPPTWLRSSLYLLLGWASVLLVPQVYDACGLGAIILLAGGGLLYTLGAIVYVRREPNPIPGVFGFHEVFHAFVVAAAVAHFAAIAFYAVPQAS